MTVITTLKGKKVDYLKPKRINLEDVALGLSRMPRFAGQTKIPFSVAQHSLLVAELCPRHRMKALLHDAQEYLLCDIPTPAKEAMRELANGDSPYDILEDRLHMAICDEVGIAPFISYPVHLADREARKIEARVLRGNGKPGIYGWIFDLKDGGRKEWLEAVSSRK